jgi:hypothetical protein
MAASRSSVGNLARHDDHSRAFPPQKGFSEEHIAQQLRRAEGHFRPWLKTD